MSNHMTITRDAVFHQVKLACLIPAVVEGLITKQIINRVAAAQEIQVQVDELQQAADKLRITYNLLNAKETWVWLQKHGLSIDDFEEIVHTTVLSSKLAHHLFADQVDPFFIEHQLDYLQVVMYEIVLEDEDLAMELFYALQEGEANFHQIAHQFIEDPALRRAGGYRGLLRRTDLKPEIAAAVFSATPPQLLKPIITAKGAHLIFVEEVLHPQLDETMRSKILGELFAEWLQRQIAQVEVNFADKSLSNQDLSNATLNAVAASR